MTHGEHLRLVTIDEWNYEECIKLHVAPHQRKHNHTPVQILAESYAIRWLIARGISAKKANTEQLVGMVLWGPNLARRVNWITEFFIDERLQKRGLGAKAIRLVVEHILKLDPDSPVVVNVDFPNPEIAHDGNVDALRFYKKNGFCEQEMQAFGKKIKYLVYDKQMAQQADAPEPLTRPGDP